MSRLIDADEFEKRIKPYDTTDVMDKALYNFAHNQVICMPTACDIEQISSARYNNGFYDGKKAMEEKLEQIRAEIEFERDRKLGGEAFEAVQYKSFNKALKIIDRYTKGDRK